MVENVLVGGTLAVLVITLILLADTREAGSATTQLTQQSSLTEPEQLLALILVRCIRVGTLAKGDERRRRGHELSIELGGV